MGLHELMRDPDIIEGHALRKQQAQRGLVLLLLCCCSGPQQEVTQLWLSEQREVELIAGPLGLQQIRQPGSGRSEQIGSREPREGTEQARGHAYVRKNPRFTFTDVGVPRSVECPPRPDAREAEHATEPRDGAPTLLDLHARGAAHTNRPSDLHGIMDPDDRNQEATCYVGDLDPQVNESLLWELMVQAGPVVNVHIPKDKMTQQHMGFGFVEFKGEQDAEYAIKILNMIKVLASPSE